MPDAEPIVHTLRPGTSRTSCGRYILVGQHWGEHGTVVGEPATCERCKAPEKKPREPWWTWHWDKAEAYNADIPLAKLTRWRRGSFLTLYRHETIDGSVQWWFYGPFNLAIGFAKG
jgi:hypothetical protein